MVIPGPNWGSAHRDSGEVHGDRFRLRWKQRQIVAQAMMSSGVVVPWKNQTKRERKETPSSGLTEGEGRGKVFSCGARESEG